MSAHIKWAFTLASCTGLRDAVASAWHAYWAASVTIGTYLVRPYSLSSVAAGVRWVSPTLFYLDEGHVYSKGGRAQMLLSLSPTKEIVAGASP